MKITISEEARGKIEPFLSKDMVVIVDLDDGVGPFSHKLLENGLKYRLIVLDKGRVPAQYNIEFSSIIGNIFTNQDTFRYLQPELKISLNPKWNILNLKSDDGLLEGNLTILKQTEF